MREAHCASILRILFLWKKEYKPTLAFNILPVVYLHDIFGEGAEGEEWRRVGGVGTWFVFRGGGRFKKVGVFGWWDRWDGAGEGLGGLKV